MKYVALLRGINVGGKAKVEMLRLKQVFESVGCESVVTYINSGNVIFSDDRTPADLVGILERAVTEAFGLEMRMVLASQAVIRAICQDIPSSWTNDDKQKTDVMFLRPEIDDAELMGKLTINTDVESVRYCQGALVWNISRANATRSGGIKLIKTDLYAFMTVRNINTVRKLNELMGQS